MARCDDERCSKLSDRGYDFFTSGKQSIQPQLEQIRHVSHSKRVLQICGRRNHRDDLRSGRTRHSDRRENGVTIKHSPEISSDQVEFKVDEVTGVSRVEIRLLTLYAE